MALNTDVFFVTELAVLQAAALEFNILQSKHWQLKEIVYCTISFLHEIFAFLYRMCIPTGSVKHADTS